MESGSHRQHILPDRENVMQIKLKVNGREVADYDFVPL